MQSVNCAAHYAAAASLLGFPSNTGLVMATAAFSRTWTDGRPSRTCMTRRSTRLRTIPGRPGSPSEATPRYAFSERMPFEMMSRRSCTQAGYKPGL